MQLADRERSSLAARTEALEMGLNRRDGAGALLAATDHVSGLLGSVAALLSVRSGYETAVAAALGSAADAVAVTDPDAAIAAIDHLKTHDLGRAGLVLGGGPPRRRPWPGLPEPPSYAVDAVECPDELRPSLVRLLHKVAVVDDLAAARALVAELPDVTAVTREGDVLGAFSAAGGSSQPSLLEIQAAVDEASAQLAEATPPASGWGSTSPGSRASGSTPAGGSTSPWPSCTSPTPRWRRWPSSSGSSARRPGRHVPRPSASTPRSATPSPPATRTWPDSPTSSSGLPPAETASDEEPDTTERERLAEAARTARGREMEARLALRTSEERGRALHGRADSLLAAAQAEREARARAAERRERLVREGRAAQAVGTAVAATNAPTPASPTATVTGRGCWRPRPAMSSCASPSCARARSSRRSWSRAGGSTRPSTRW